MIKIQHTTNRNKEGAVTGLIGAGKTLTRKVKHIGLSQGGFTRVWDEYGEMWIAKWNGHQWESTAHVRLPAN